MELATWVTLAQLYRAVALVMFRNIVLYAALSVNAQPRVKLW